MDTLIDGSIELLEEAISGLEEVGIEKYVVIGGWCPYLRRGAHSHPGTIDVDILFREGQIQGSLKPYIQYMRDKKGFFTSAKHQFQLLTVKEIKGERFCFNIDLLHTNPGNSRDELFADHLDIDVLLSEEERSRIKMKSIVQQESEILFQHEMFDSFQLNNGVKFNLVDFTGMFLTKAVSCQKQKRDRDSYDIYIGLVTNQIDFEKLKVIAKEDLAVKKALTSMINFLKVNTELFDNRVKLFNSSIDGSPANEILSKLIN